ncbi:hypothetical protein BO71DRAFT_239435 [Aspergillus ellipticus CBS 707.79]|uniref:Uncharacterized protein n=1 Tax=Aspergillus ellipticus CBS 707.79 TaxID=1448320 RepID=A0A319D9W2_9EURO|nr:hypothetical protein BO71DRAFT_239435 [Aspergillus ellipticus CBS 707.79]
MESTLAGGWAGVAQIGEPDGRWPMADGEASGGGTHDSQILDCCINEAADHSLGSMPGDAMRCDAMRCDATERTVDEEERKRERERERERERKRGREEDVELTASEGASSGGAANNAAQSAGGPRSHESSPTSLESLPTARPVLHRNSNSTWGHWDNNISGESSSFVGPVGAWGAPGRTGQPPPRRTPRRRGLLFNIAANHELYLSVFLPPSECMNYAG